jgi:hypothetical protein
VDFAFNFQIAGDKKRMLSRFERFNIVGKEVIIIPRIDADSSKKQRLVVPWYWIQSVDQASYMKIKFPIMRI